MSGPIEEFLGEVSRGIGEVDALVLQEALAEMRGHLEESALGFEELGEGREEAERMAVSAFGDQRVAAKAIPVEQGVKQVYSFDWLQTGLAAGLAVVGLGAYWIFTILHPSIDPRFADRYLLMYAVAALIFGFGACFRAFKKGISLTGLVAGVVIGWVTVSGWAAPQIACLPGQMQWFGQFERSPLVSVARYDYERMRYFEQLPSANKAFRWNTDMLWEFQRGNEAEAMARSRTEEGYAGPIGANTGKQTFSPDYESVVQSWRYGARKLNLDQRERLYAEQRDYEIGHWMRVDDAGTMVRISWALGGTWIGALATATGLLFFAGFSGAMGRFLRRRRPVDPGWREE